MTKDEYKRVLAWLLGDDCARVRAANVALYGTLFREDTDAEAAKRQADLILAEVGIREENNEE